MARRGSLVCRCECVPQSTSLKSTSATATTTASASTRRHGYEHWPTGASSWYLVPWPTSLGISSLAKLELRSLGSHRVRDFPRREDVFQVNGPGQDVEFPPLNAVDLSAPPLAASALIDIAGATAHVAALTHEGLGRSADEVAAHSPSVVRLAARPLPQTVGRRLPRLFDTPDEAVAFACECKTALASDGATLRGGVHFGPVELLGDDVSGQSLWLTAKILRARRARPDPWSHRSLGSFFEGR